MTTFLTLVNHDLNGSCSATASVCAAHMRPNRKSCSVAALSPPANTVTNATHACMANTLRLKRKCEGRRPRYR